MDTLWLLGLIIGVHSFPNVYACRGVVLGNYLIAWSYCLPHLFKLCCLIYEMNFNNS